MERITREQLLQDLQAAIAANPYGRRRTEIENNLLELLRVASDEKLGGLTVRQLAAATPHSRDWIGRKLSELEDESLVHHKLDGKVFLWYIACNEDEAG